MSSKDKTVYKMIVNGTDKIHFVNDKGEQIDPDDVGFMCNTKWKTEPNIICENFKFIEDGFEMDDVDYRYKFYVFLNLDDNTYYMFTGRYDSWEGVDWNDYDVIDVEQKQITKWMPA